MKSYLGLATAFFILHAASVPAAEPEKFVPDYPCVTQDEYEEITRRHTELGAIETEMGCRELVKFNQEIYLEKRKLHRRTAKEGLSESDYAVALAEIEERESAYLLETQDLREQCKVPFEQMLALKREVVQRGHCALSTQNPAKPH